MTEAEIRSFIDTVTQYFEEVTKTEAELGVPYIKDDEAVSLDYTGAIGISGARRGAVYLTASEAMIRDLGAIILGTAASSVASSDIVDLIGEVTNTIAGNMRRTFGSDFMISVPLVLKGKVSDLQIQLKPPVYIIPITWNGHKSYMAIGLE